MYAPRKRRMSATPMVDRDPAIEQAAAQRIEDISRTLVLLWAGLVLALLLSAPLLLLP